MDDRKDRQTSVELIQKHRTPKSSISSLTNTSNESFESKRNCYFCGAIIGFTAGIILLSIGSIMCANSFNEKASFGIKNIAIEKGLSISLILIGEALTIFAIACTVLYIKLPPQDNADILHERSYGTVDKNNEHYSKIIDTTFQTLQRLNFVSIASCQSCKCLALSTRKKIYGIKNSLRSINSDFIITQNI